MPSFLHILTTISKSFILLTSQSFFTNHLYFLNYLLHVRSLFSLSSSFNLYHFLKSHAQFPHTSFPKGFLISLLIHKVHTVFFLEFILHCSVLLTVCLHYTQLALTHPGRYVQQLCRANLPMYVEIISLYPHMIILTFAIEKSNRHKGARALVLQSHQYAKGELELCFTWLSMYVYML